MTDFRALCVELANHLQARVTKEDREVPMKGYHSQGQQLIDRARVALAEPQPAGSIVLKTGEAPIIVIDKDGFHYHGQFIADAGEAHRLLITYLHQHQPQTNWKHTND